MFIPLLLALIVVPIAELAVLIQVNQEIGLGWTLLLLLADSIIGGVLLRSQGREAWRRFNAALAGGRPPAREALDGGLVIFGGALLLTPGFLTDLVGALLLLPPTRAVARRLLLRRFATKMLAAVTRPRSARGAGTRHHDVDGTAVDADPAELPR